MKILLIAALLMVAGPALSDPIVIDMQGDSTTAGTTGVPQRYSTYAEPADLAVWLYPSATVVNNGRGGMTCYDRLNGTESWASWAYPKNIWAEMSGSKAAIVTFSYGLNDAGRYSLDFYKYCIATLIQVAKGYGKIVAIETPLGTADIVAQYANAAATVAVDNGAFLIDHMTLMDHQMPDWRSHLPDGIHPDDALYIQKASIAYVVLNPIVTSLTSR